MFVVTAKREGARYAVKCPNCDKKHRHTEIGTQKARCGFTYHVLAPAVRGRRS